MSATDELRRLLDERGVEYETDERNAITRWSTYYGAFVYFARQREGKLLVETTVATEHSVILTPEQAIAATLVDDAYDAVANEHVITAEQLHALLDEWDKHPGRAATDGEMMTYATLGGGKLTAEQVRDAIRKHAHDDSCYIFEVYGEMCGPIADELNAALGRQKVKKVRGMTYDEHGGEIYYLACSGCGDWVDGDLDCIGEHDGPNFCHNCGGEFDGPLLCKWCGNLADMEYGDMCAECYWHEGEGNDER